MHSTGPEAVVADIVAAHRKLWPLVVSNAPPERLKVAFERLAEAAQRSVPANAAGDDASGTDTVCDGTLCAVDQHVVSHQCVACPAGTSNAAGDDASGSDTGCDICGDGIISGDETCDDFNNDSCGSCNSSCDGPGADLCVAGTGCSAHSDCMSNSCTSHICD